MGKMLIERNKEITIQVLSGYSYNQVGVAFGLSEGRIRQIVMKTLSVLNLRKVVPAIDVFHLRDARKYRNRLISFIRASAIP